MPPKLLTETATADLLAVSKKTLQTWRQRGAGPAYVKLGTAVRYPLADLERWIDQHRPTAECIIRPASVPAQGEATR